MSTTLSASSAFPKQAVLPALTSIRGIAAWWVVIYHFREIMPLSDWPAFAPVIDHGDLAVDLFFVLSGFIISMNYLNSFSDFSVRPYLRFLALRLGRIYPLHLFMMILFLLNPIAIVLFSQAHDPGDRYNAVYYGLSLLLIQNWFFSNDLARNVPAWSISTEWFAYLIFPCIAWMARLTRSRLHAVFGVIGSLLVLLSATMLLDGDIPENGLWRCVLEFAAGSFVYLYWRLSSATHRHLPEFAAILWLPVFSLVFWLPVPVYPTAALAWCMLIYGLANNRTILARFLSTPLAYRIGEYSYSTYLVHYFIRDWIKFTLVGGNMNWPLELGLYLLGTAIASVVLYHLVEVPGRTYVRKLVGMDRSPLGSSFSIRRSP